MIHSNVRPPYILSSSLWKFQGSHWALVNQWLPSFDKGSNNLQIRSRVISNLGPGSLLVNSYATFALCSFHQHPLLIFEQPLLLQKIHLQDFIQVQGAAFNMVFFHGIHRRIHWSQIIKNNNKWWTPSNHISNASWTESKSAYNSM